ncbi:MAG: O-antigen ligase family protein [Bacteroidota bacterium]
MSQLLNILKKDTIYFFILSAVAATLFVPKYSINSMAMIVLVLTWLLKMDMKNIYRVQQNKIIYAFLLLYLVFLIGIFYSENIKGANKLLSLRLPIVLFPLICLTIGKFSVSQTKLFKNIFIFSALAACLYCHACIIGKWLESGTGFMELFKSREYSYMYITNYIDLHPTYFSYLLILCLLFIETKLNSKISLKYKTLLFAIGTYFVLFIIHMTSKIALIGLVLLFFFYLGRSIYQKKYKNSLVLLSLLVLGIFTASRFEYTVKRYKEVIHIFIPQKKVVHSNEGYRLYSMQAFKEEFPKHPIMGIGLADGQKQLDVYYEKIGFPHMKGLNYHNQYVQILIEHGIIGFVVFIIALLWPVILSIKRKNKEFFLFLVTTILFLLAENMFIRHKGLVSFALFNALFLFTLTNQVIPKEPTNEIQSN